MIGRMIGAIARCAPIARCVLNVRNGRIEANVQIVRLNTMITAIGTIRRFAPCVPTVQHEAIALIVRLHGMIAAIGIIKRFAPCVPIDPREAIARCALSVLSVRNGRIVPVLAALIGGAIAVSNGATLIGIGHLNPNHFVPIVPNLMNLRFKKLRLILSQM
jgi:hypothetical protein